MVVKQELRLSGSHLTGKKEVDVDGFLFFLSFFLLVRKLYYSNKRKNCTTLCVVLVDWEGRLNIKREREEEEEDA